MEGRRATSHYLIHATRHPLGFKIMKDVMWSVGKTDEGDGGLALEQASVSDESWLFSPKWDAIKRSVLNELAAGAKQARHFYETLTALPDNRLCESAYRKALLELESDGLVVVLDKAGRLPTPATKRRQIKNTPTLAKDYFVKLNT